MDQGITGSSGESQSSAASKLSYKFQRLRERLRNAISSGELAGKLPGERQLAKRFHVNAKTLSKALTDLAAEGLLDRSIGRGTFVKGSSPAPVSNSADRWLVICDEDQINSGIIEQLKKSHENVQVATNPAALRPSFLNSVKAAIDLGTHTPDAFVRDLIVRNITVVLVGREPTNYSVNAVLVDRSLAGSCLARDMMIAGHRRFLAVERRGQTAVVQSIRNAAHRFAPDSSVDSVYPSDVVVAIEQHQASAIICDTRKAATQVREILERRGISIPNRVSLAAIGSGWGEYPCSGYYLHSQQKADTVIQLINEPNLKRPTTIWLTGTFHDGATIAAPEGIAIGAMQRDSDSAQQRMSVAFPPPGR